MADTVVVNHKYSERVGNESKEREVVGIAKVSSNLHQAHAKRGYTVTNFVSVSDLTNHSAAEAQKRAETLLKRDQRELVEWQLTTTYLPLWEGDVVELVVHDGMKDYQGVRKCLVKIVDIDLLHMTMQLTLKETASGDKGDEDA